MSGIAGEPHTRKKFQKKEGRATAMGGHVLIIPFPAQGHVAPLMKLAHMISDHGIKVTFVNSHFIHGKVVAALQPDEAEARSRVRLASIPDGLDPGNDQRDLVKLVESITKVMPGHLKGLIDKVNNWSANNDDEKITCIIADISLGRCPIELAEKMGIHGFPFCPLGPGTLAWAFHIPKLIEAGIINSADGSPHNDELICVSKEFPALSSNRLPWSCPVDLKVQEVIFQNHLVIQTTDFSKWILCNFVSELESSASELFPNMLPMGPLLASSHHAGNFWPQDSTCLSWLDEQPVGSVIYVAFGSIAILTQGQFNELALALELSGRPFLWVVRSDFADGSAAEFPDGFIERILSNDQRGKIVSWAPQEEVLAHPSVACFLSHSGWNSTMDGLAMGVPFLCWPCFGDQFLNQVYICDKWKVGLELNPDESGVISRHEIKRKIENLVSDEGIKANAEKMKEMARKSVSEGGSSYKNFKTFIKAVKH